MESQLNFSGKLGFKSTLPAVSKSESCRHIIWAACGVFLLALAVRLFYLYESSEGPTFGVPIVDARGYDLIARELVNERKMPKQFFWQQFFYPCFLSVVYFLSNCSVVVAQVIQAVLGAVSCVLTFFLGRAVFNRRTGILAAIFVAFYGPLIFHEIDLIAVGWAAFWSLVLILLFLRVAAGKQQLAFFLLGLCGALSIITRPNFVPFFLAGMAWVGFVFYKARTGRFFVARYFFLIVLGFTLIALPVAIQNLRVTGHFGILPASGGVNLYMGNSPDFEAAEIRLGTKWERLVALPAQHGVTGDMWQKQEFFYEKTRDCIVSDPIGFLKRLAVKAMQLICSREIPGDVDIYLFRQWSKLLEFLMWKAGAFGFPFGLVLPLAILGLVYNRRKIPMPVILFVITYPLPIILTHVKTRYRVPMVPVLSILAASGCICLIKSIVGRDWLRSAGAVCLGVGIVFLATFPGPFTAEKLDYHAELYFSVGKTLKDQGKIDEAVENYTEALRIKANYPDVHHNLGVILCAEGKIEEAIEHYKKAIELDTIDHEAHCGLGVALYQLGRFEEAQQHFTEAIKLRPDYSPAHKNLAIGFARQRKIEQAVSHYKRALDFEPDDADTHKKLGMILARQGKFGEAVKHFEDAIDIREDFVEAHKALSMALASMGKPDQAIAQFHKVLQLKSTDVEAHYFLGVLLAQKGDIDEAIREFREVLRLSPDHAAAQNSLDMLLPKSRNSDSQHPSGN